MNAITTVQKNRISITVTRIVREPNVRIVCNSTMKLAVHGMSKLKVNTIPNTRTNSPTRCGEKLLSNLDAVVA